MPDADDDAPELGSEVALPSGLKVRITAASDSQRPWEAVSCGLWWRVLRGSAYAMEGGTSWFYGGGRTPLQMDERDASALAGILNRVRPGRYPMSGGG